MFLAWLLATVAGVLIVLGVAGLRRRRITLAKCPLGVWLWYDHDRPETDRDELRLLRGRVERRLNDLDGCTPR